MCCDNNIVSSVNVAEYAAPVLLNGARHFTIRANKGANKEIPGRFTFRHRLVASALYRWPYSNIPYTLVHLKTSSTE